MNDTFSTNTQAATKVLMLVLNDVTHDSRVRREADALTRSGYEVHVIGTHTASSPLPDMDRVRGWQLTRFRYGRSMGKLRRFRALNSLRHLWQAIALIRFLREHSTDIWHAHDFPALALISLARLGRKNPGTLVYDVHDLYFNRTPLPTLPWSRLRRRLGLITERLLARRAEALIAVSPKMAEFLASQWHTPPPTVIVNGAENPINVPPLPRPPGARLWLIHTGGLVARGRRLPDILLGMALTAPDIHLTFLGEGEQRAPLQTIAQRLGISERVHFLPPVPPEQVSAAIRSADAAVVAFDAAIPNYALTLPNKLFEGIAAGLPVLGAQTPALTHFYAEYAVGMLWEADDPDSLRRAVRALADSEARQKWQQAAQRTQKQIGWASQAKNIITCYQNLEVAV